MSAFDFYLFFASELPKHKFYFAYCNLGEWIMQDSNPQPSGYEPDALTSWANDPFVPR